MNTEIIKGLYTENQQTEIKLINPVKKNFSPQAIQTRVQYIKWLW